MSFEIFKEKGGRARYSFPVVTLQASGGISMNDKAFEALGRPSHVVLYYDKKESKIGLKGSDGSEQYAFPLRDSGSGTAWSTSVKSFFMYYTIDQQETRRFKVVKDRESGLLVIDLKEPLKTMKRRSRSGHTPGKLSDVPSEGTE